MITEAMPRLPTNEEVEEWHGAWRIPWSEVKQPPQDFEWRAWRLAMEYSGCPSLWTMTRRGTECRLVPFMTAGM